MTEAVAAEVGDFVKTRSEDDGRCRIGIVHQLVERPGKALVRICAPGAGFGTVVELIERPSDPAVIAEPTGRLPIPGDMVTYEPHEGAGSHTGRVWGVYRLHNGRALVRIGQQDAPLCRVIEFVGGAEL